MKKFILILLFFLLIASKCDKKPDLTFASYEYEQTYGINEEAQSIHDLFILLHNYNQDSIPLTKWPGFMGTNDSGFILQQILTKYSDTVNYIFIYNTYKIADSTFYSIKVRKINLPK